MTVEINNAMRSFLIKRDIQPDIVLAQLEEASDLAIKIWISMVTGIPIELIGNIDDE